MIVYLGFLPRFFLHFCHLMEFRFLDLCSNCQLTKCIVYCLFAWPNDNVFWLNFIFCRLDWSKYTFCVSSRMFYLRWQSFSDYCFPSQMCNRCLQMQINNLNPVSLFFLTDTTINLFCPVSKFSVLPLRGSITVHPGMWISSEESSWHQKVNCQVHSNDFRLILLKMLCPGFKWWKSEYAYIFFLFRLHWSSPFNLGNFDLPLIIDWDLFVLSCLSSCVFTLLSYYYYQTLHRG